MAAHRTKQNSFTRQRLLTFPRLCALIIQKTARSAHAHLVDFFSCASWPGRTPTVSAWTQARAKLSHTAFIELNEKAILANVYTDTNAPALRRWRGLRLLAIDTSLLRLPAHESVIEAFGWTATGNKSGPTAPVAQARLSVLYDVFNEMGVQTLVNKATRAEREIALEHLPRLQSDDLAVLDRGFAGYELFARFLQAGRHFVCRCQRHTFPAARALFQDGPGGQSLVVALSRPASLAKTNLPDQILVRMVNVRLPTGQMETLATSLLDETLYASGELAEVYRARWGIETYYGRLKGRLDLEHFSGQTLEAVLQDIHATVYLCNLESILIGPAQAEMSGPLRPTEPEPHVNHAVAFHAIKHQAIELLLGDQDLGQTLARLKEMFLRNAQKPRPGRSGPRQSSIARGYHFQRNVRKFVY